jgi:hypothetical protein
MKERVRERRRLQLDPAVAQLLSAAGVALVVKLVDTPS